MPRRRRLRAILARRLRVLVEARGLPMTHVADRASMARSYLWKILNQESAVSLETVERLAEVLEVDPLDLLRDPDA